MPRLLTYSTLYFEAREVMAFLGRKLHGQLPGRRGHRPSRLQPDAQTATGAAGETPDEAQLDEDVQQGRRGAAGRDRDQRPRGISHPPARATPRALRDGVGSPAQGRRLSVALSRDLRAVQRSLPRRAGARRRPHARHPRTRCAECPGRDARRPHGAHGRRFYPPGRGVDLSDRVAAERASRTPRPGTGTRRRRES